MIDQGGEPLSSSARSLLDAAREGMGPDAAAVGRVRAKVGAAAGAGTAIAIKLGVVGAVAALAIAAFYNSRDHAAETPALDLPSARSETSPLVVRPANAAAAEPAPIEMAPQSAQRARPVVKGVDLAREVELIDLAMAALRNGDAATALATVQIHARETRGAGQLAEDAAAIEVEALCRLHDPSVAAKLDSFDAAYPRSAQRSRLTTVCR